MNANNIGSPDAPSDEELVELFGPNQDHHRFVLLRSLIADLYEGEGDRELLVILSVGGTFYSGKAVTRRRWSRHLAARSGLMKNFNELVEAAPEPPAPTTFEIDHIHLIDAVVWHPSAEKPQMPGSTWEIAIDSVGAWAFGELTRSADVG